MGMAASQARFLCLTARKSNTEYQGQQVNQQRTILANESAGLYNQMLEMEVPTPPSSSDYYKTTYSFSPSSDGEESKYSFTTSPQLVAANTYKIGVSWDVETIQMALSKKSSSVTQEDDGSFSNFTYNGTSYALTPVTFDSDGYDTSNRNSSTDENGNVTYEALDEDSKRTTISKETLQNLYNTSDDEKYYCFGSDEVDGIKYYIPESKLNKIAEDTKEGNSNLYNVYYPNYVTGKAYGYVKGELTKSDSGRCDTLTITESDVPDLSVQGNERLTCQLVTKEVRDDEGYEEAMNEYEYKKAKYDKQIEDINSQTDLIQQKDKSLELKLKQLDTEQEALKNELEAVQEVINKNVESTFTTFKA